MQAAMRIAIAAARAAGRRVIRGGVPPAQQQGDSGAGEAHAAGAAQRVASHHTGASMSSGTHGGFETAQQGAGASQAAGGDAGADDTAAAADAGQSAGGAARPVSSGDSRAAASAADAMPDARAVVAVAPTAGISSAGASSGDGLWSSSRHASQGCPAAAPVDVPASPVSPVAAAAVAGVNPVSPPAPLWRQHGHVSPLFRLPCAFQSVSDLLAAAVPAHRLCWCAASEGY